jgi:hypothetical protein
LTLFTGRAFAGFFGAICLSSLSLIWARNLTPMFAYGLAGIILTIPIVTAALVNLDKFDFAARPGGILYLGSYLFTLIVTLWGVWYYHPAFNQANRITGW